MQSQPIVEVQIGEELLQRHGLHVHGVVVLDELVNQLFEGREGIERVLVLEALHVKYYMGWTVFGRFGLGWNGKYIKDRLKCWISKE